MWCLGRKEINLYIYILHPCPLLPLYVFDSFGRNAIIVFLHCNMWLKFGGLSFDLWYKNDCPWHGNLAQCHILGAWVAMERLSKNEKTVQRGKLESKIRIRYTYRQEQVISVIKAFDSCYDWISLTLFSHEPPQHHGQHCILYSVVHEVKVDDYIVYNHPL